MSAPDARFVDARQVRRNFSRAAAGYDAAAFLAREVDRRMLDRLDYVRIAPERILDLGCANGWNMSRFQQYGRAPMGLDVVPAASPLRNLDDALAAAAPGAPLPFASCGNGTPQHLAGEMLARATGAVLQHVPYKGCGPALTDVAAGQVGLGVVTASSAAPLIAAMTERPSWAQDLPLRAAGYVAKRYRKD